MFNLSAILNAAQGGQAIENIAEQFGLSPEQAQQAVHALLPALSAGFKTQASDPTALADVASQVGDPQHQAAFQDPDVAQSDEAQMAGQQALTRLVGGDAAVSAIADRAAQETGLSPELLQQMLPQITSVALGGVMTALRRRGLDGAVQQLGSSSGGLGSLVSQFTGGQSGGVSGILGGLVGSFLGGSKPETDAAPSGDAQAGLGALMQMFEHGAAGSSPLEQDFAKIINDRS